MVDDKTTNGNYDIYVVNVDDSGDATITDNGYTQGLAIWSHLGEQIMYILSAIQSDVKYDI